MQSIMEARNSKRERERERERDGNNRLKIIKKMGCVVSFKMGPRLEQTGPALVNF